MLFSKCLQVKIYCNVNVHFDPQGCQTLLLKESELFFLSLGSWTKGQFKDKLHFFRIPGVFEDQCHFQGLFKVCANPVSDLMMLNPTALRKAKIVYNFGLSSKILAFLSVIGLNS